MAESVDAPDLKSVGLTPVRVQVPLSAPRQGRKKRKSTLFGESVDLAIYVLFTYRYAKVQRISRLLGGRLAGPTWWRLYERQKRQNVAQEEGVDVVRLIKHVALERLLIKFFFTGSERRKRGHLSPLQWGKTEVRAFRPEMARASLNEWA